MIIPSIDLMGGSTVQLVGGKDKALDAGDPLPLAERFALAGEIAVVDLDAALGKGHNRELIGSLLATAPCRVGGGIRDLQTAIDWLDAGAAKIVIGTAAKPELLSQLPKERLIAALDAVEGEVVVEGWQTKTGQGIAERMRELGPYVGGFLVTFVELEGRMQGTALDRVQALAEAAGEAKLTIAGGVTTLSELAALDAMGVDAQVGMALYTGKMTLADAIVAPLLQSQPDKLWPTVVVDEAGRALGLVWSNRESVREAVSRRQGVYHSRRRGLWVKGERSGNTQTLHRIELDCDRDALRFAVSQQGRGFCHRDTWTCWGPDTGLPALMRTIESRKQSSPKGSYTQRLFAEPELLAKKLLEEAGELAAAQSAAEVSHEAADVLYFTLARLAQAGVSLGDVERVLARRALRLTRRPGDAKN